MKYVLERVPARTWVLLSVLVVLVVVAWVATPNAVSAYNLYTVTGAAVEVTILALAQLLVISTGRGAIDLSVGSTLSLASASMGLAIGAGLPWYLVVATALGVGAVAGCINGVMVSVLRIPPLIATLATLYAYGSLALLISRAAPVSGVPVELVGMTMFTGAPVPLQLAIVLVPLAIIVWFVMEHTVIGRDIRTTGINASAARLTGVRIRAIDFWPYVAAGLLAATAAVLFTARFSSARPDAGTGLELQAITIAVLGGVSILGGTGTVGGVLCAGLLVAFSSNLLSLNGVPAEWQLGLLAGLLLLGSLTDSRLREYLRRLASRRHRPTPPASMTTSTISLHSLGEK